MAEREGLLALRPRTPGRRRFAATFCASTRRWLVDPSCLIEGSNSLSTFSLRQAIRPVLKKWRRGRDSNPRYAINVYTLSRRALSTTQPPLRRAPKGIEVEPPTQTRLDQTRFFRPVTSRSNPSMALSLCNAPKEALKAQVSLTPKALPGITATPKRSMRLRARSRSLPS